MAGGDDGIEPLSLLCPPALREVLRSATLSLTRPVWGRRHGRHRSARAGVGLDFRDHRPYVPGDDLRMLDWRAVARRERPVVRRTEAEDELSIVLIVDSGGNMEYGDGEHSKMSCARGIAGGLAWLAGRQGDPVGLAVGYDGIVDATLARPSSNPERQIAFARALSASPVSGRCPWPELLDATTPRLPRRSLVVVLSDFLDASGSGDATADDQLLRGLSHLRGRGHDVVLVQVLHRDETEFPWGDQRSVKFLDLFGHRRATEGAASAFRDQYLEAFEAHQAQLFARSEAEGLFLERVRCDEELSELFIGLLARLAGTPIVRAETAS